MLRTAIGKLIHEARKKWGLTQKQLADMMKCSQSTVSRLEKGTARDYKDFQILEAAAKLMNCKINVSLTEQGREETNMK